VVVAFLARNRQVDVVARSDCLIAEQLQLDASGRTDMLHLR